MTTPTAQPRARRASELGRRGSVNVYLIDPERLSLDTVQETLDDLYPGETVMLHRMFRDKVNLAHILQHSSEVKRHMMDFNPETDRLIIIGRSLANFLAGWVMGLMGFTQITLLMYVFETRSYEEMVIESGAGLGIESA